MPLWSKSAEVIFGYPEDLFQILLHCSRMSNRPMKLPAVGVVTNSDEQYEHGLFEAARITD